MTSFRPLLFLPLLALAACDRYDYHGVDPRVYNEVLYPKENKVEETAIYQSFYFPRHQDAFASPALAELQRFVGDIYPSAVDQITLTFPAENEARSLYVTRLLRAKGFTKRDIRYAYQPELGGDEVQIHLAYSYVITPDCPDWRKSSSLNYSNTNISQLGCASVTNLGRQMAHPRDLTRARAAHVPPDAVLGATAIDNYHKGEIDQSAYGTGASGGQ